MAMALAVYLASAVHKIPGGDSGELLAEACVRGVAHPPGYPLLLRLLRLVRHVATGMSFAHAANVLNAVLAAAAAACVAHVVDMLTKRQHPWEAIAAGLVFAFSRLVWEHAIGIEVFALNNLLAGVLHVLFVRHCWHPRVDNARWGAFICGLALANQHTIVLLEIPGILWVLWSGRHTFKIADVASFALAYDLSCSFLVGLCACLDTMVFGTTPTRGSWGDTATIAGFARHWTRQEYGTFQLSPRTGKSESLVERLSVYAEDTASEFQTFGVFMSLCGIVYLGTLPKRLRSTLSMLLFYLVVFHSLANIPLDDPLSHAVSSRFSMQPNVIVAIWLGTGLAGLLHTVRSFAPSRLRQHSWVLSTLIGKQFMANWAMFEPTAHDDLLRTYAKSVLDTMPKNALLLSFTDINWNTIRYLQECELYRQDVTHLSLQVMPFPWFTRQHALYPAVDFPAISSDVSTDKASEGYVKYISRFIIQNLRDRAGSVFLDLHAVLHSDIGVHGEYHSVRLRPFGLVWQVQEPLQLVSPLPLYDTFVQWSASDRVRTESIHEAFFTPSVGTRPPVAGTWEFVAVSIVHDSLYQSALHRLSTQIDRQISAIEQLPEYIDELWEAERVLALVTSHIDRTHAFTYSVYDAHKNHMLSRMRVQLALEVLDSVTAKAASTMTQQYLSKWPSVQKLVQETPVTARGEEVRRAVAVFVRRMKTQNDADAAAFEKFVHNRKNQNVANDDQNVKKEKKKGKKRRKQSKNKAGE
ncbi:TPA: hypothetical protein N0F65_009662 [Lagenidium giganteum]|uniref:Uncharacterized protein n=1 Tax=Lagenidium giganteum TaxID=4803 RepID=A0AAV2YVE1_9STRA|nr:TPA: hypothetical protein N0F65_009662 [Lagenidium giganteum]